MVKINPIRKFISLDKLLKVLFKKFNTEEEKIIYIHDNRRDINFTSLTVFVLSIISVIIMGIIKPTEYIYLVIQLVTSVNLVVTFIITTQANVGYWNMIMKQRTEQRKREKEKRQKEREEREERRQKEREERHKRYDDKYRKVNKPNQQLQKHLKVLNISHITTDINEIKKAYRKAMKQNHPDIGGSENTAKTINNSYNEIKKVLNTNY